jgi:hypothetical protein
MQILAPSTSSTRSAHLRRRGDFTHLELIERFSEKGGLASTDELVSRSRNDASRQAMEKS